MKTPSSPCRRPLPAPTALALLLLAGCAGGDDADAPAARGDALGSPEGAAPPAAGSVPPAQPGTSPAGEPGAPGPEPSHGPLPEGASGPPPSAPEGWTAGVVDVASGVEAGDDIPEIRTLRTGTHPGWDRLTVEMDGDGGTAGYRLEYVDKPLHECGSGREIHPLGDAWLELRLEPARAHTEEGEATLPGRELPTEERLLRRTYLTCNFEGVVTLVLALSSPNPFRVLTLADPPRVVVDVRH